MSSPIQNIQTVRKPGPLDRSKKTFEYSGTPDTQPETPDSYSNFDTPIYNSDRRSCDIHHVFSPIGHSSINLQMDYEVEANYTNPIEQTEFTHEFDLTPVADQSSKRRMFEALRAIARTPEKEHKDNHYSTKKDLMSALRGFAGTPAKKAELAMTTGIVGENYSNDDDGLALNEDEDEDENAAVEASSDSSKALCENINTAMNTPSKNDFDENQDAGAVADIVSLTTPDNSAVHQDYEKALNACTPYKNTTKGSLDSSHRMSTLDRSDFYSPKTKEIMQLNLTLKNLKSKLYDGIDESDDANTSEALEDYRAAVEDYRVAMQEFESEMSQATKQRELTEAPYDERPTSDAQTPIVKSDNSLSYSDDDAVLPDIEHVHGVLDGLDQEDDSLVCPEESFAKESPTESHNSPKKKGDITLEETMIHDTEVVCIDAKKCLLDLSNGGISATNTLNVSMEESAVPSQRVYVHSPESKQSSTPNGSSLKSTNPIIGTSYLHFQEKFAMCQSELPDVSPAKSDFTSVYGGASVASTAVTQMNIICDTSNPLVATKEFPLDRNIVSSVRTHSSAEAKQSNLIKVNNLDSANSTTPNTKDISFGSTSANSGSKPPTLQEKFAMFQSDLPDISPAKSDFTSVHGGVSVASTVLTQKTAASDAIYLEVLKRAIFSNEECEITALSPNLLDKAMDTYTFNTKNEGALSNDDHIAFKSTDNDTVPSPNLLDKACSDVKSELGTSYIKSDDKFKKYVSSNLLNDATNGNNVLPLQSTPKKCSIYHREFVRDSMQKGDDAEAPSYLPCKYESKTNSTVLTSIGNRATVKGNQNLSVLGNDSKILTDVLKLNLGPALTKEIMQSLVSRTDNDNGDEKLGINHINIDIEHDDHSEVSSLGTTASIFSNAALSTLSALARSNPTESIDNIIRGFNRLQRWQSPENVNDVQNNGPSLSSQENESTPMSKRATSGSPFNQTGRQNQTVKLQPSKIDFRRGRRRFEVQGNTMKKEVPAVAADVFNDFERLQQQIGKAERHSRVIEIANKKAEKFRYENEHEKLMNQFEHIEKLECQRRWDAVTTTESLDCHRVPIIVPKVTPLKANAGTTNDWFVQFDTTSSNSNGNDTNEPFSSLLHSDKALADESLIEEKKRAYADKEDENGMLNNIDNDEGEGKSELKKKKRKKKVLKKMVKMMRRKKKSNKDDEGSIGIASVTSFNTVDDTVKKKYKFNFLSSLKRRKSKKMNNKLEQENLSQLFEEDSGQVSESIIIDTMDMIDSQDVDDLDESFSTDDSDGSSHVSKNSFAYATLS